MDASTPGAKLFAIFALRLAPALALALALSACIGPDLNSVGDYGAGLSPFATASVPDRPRPIQVFIASTRKGETGDAARQQAAEPHYALATMTVPPGHHAGSIEEPLWGRPNGRNDIALAGERELDDDEFRAELASHLSGRIGVNRDVLVFVHGFNTSFEEARLRATQIAADAHFGGVTVAFTWPSKSDVFGYVSDKDSATASRDALQGLFHDLGQTPGVGKVHILAHSMGGWLSMEALRALAIAGDKDLSGHLGDVILASPDIDITVFASQMARVRPADVTVFATPNDRALSLSSFVASSRQRVGAIDASKPEDRAEIESFGAKAVDITAYSDADRFISHAVFANSAEVIGAIGAQIAKPRAEDARTVSLIDATKYQDPDAAPSALIAAPGSPAATAVLAVPLAPAGAPESTVPAIDHKPAS
jgi:esterase/lipase superfamily enzyme